MTALGALSAKPTSHERQITIAVIVEVNIKIFPAEFSLRIIYRRKSQAARGKNSRYPEEIDHVDNHQLLLAGAKEALRFLDDCLASTGMSGSEWR